MVIVGHALSLGTKPRLLALKGRGVGRSEPARPVELHKPPANRIDPRHFLAESPSRHQPRTSTGSEKPVNDRSRLTEKLTRHIGVDDQAHVIRPKSSALL